MNHLKDETSPYLLQHAGNPVDWYPWTDKALSKAKDENKLLIISIGYTACHWCHVMEHECFEDHEVANAMNRHFVSIKVDREERPDIDQVYMSAAFLITGRGGWPLNIIALPDGRPVYAGTYFPKIDWLTVLNHFSSLFPEKEEEMKNLAETIHTELVRLGKPLQGSQNTSSEDWDPDLFFDKWLTNLDFISGGIRGAPKFPMPVNVEYLMGYALTSGKREAGQWTALSLDKIAMGGIFDHLGGGFCRYSTDDRWHIPHFEKMLYDNAQLISLYSHAYQYFRNPLYQEIVFSTIAFIERDLYSPGGLFYSSLDADSEGMEGRFYTWTSEEIKALTGENAALFMEFFHVTTNGNWEEGMNILYRERNEPELSRKYFLEGHELTDRIKKANELLLKARNQRVHPGRDTKILTSWNALMINGYVSAFLAFGEPDHLKTAIHTMEIILKKYIQQDGQLFRVMDNKQRMISGFLDDYSFTIKALITLYQATFNEFWLEKAVLLVNYVLTHFHDAQSGLFYYTPDTGEALINRTMERSDNVIASSNSQMGINLLILGHLLGKEKWISQAKKMINCVKDDMASNPNYYANWAILQSLLSNPPYEVSVVGPNWKELQTEFSALYLPHVIFSGGDSEGRLEILKGKPVPGKTLIYVCRDKVCQLPVDTVEAALLLM
jgi:uncharacterized protein